MSEQKVIEFADKADGEGIAVRGYLHIPAKASDDGLVLTHGAGGNSNSDLLKALAAEFCEFGDTVLRCDLPFRQRRPNGPPFRGSAERDRAGLRKAIGAMRERVNGRVFLGGHSYGGRQSSILAASQDGLVDRLLLLSYPLHPPGEPEQLRTAHFPGLHVSALFVHGTRDNFGTIEELQEALERVPAPTKVLVVEDAGHSLLTKRNRVDLPHKILRIFRETSSAL